MDVNVCDERALLNYEENEQKGRLTPESVETSEVERIPLSTS